MIYVGKVSLGSGLARTSAATVIAVAAALGVPLAAQAAPQPLTVTLTGGAGTFTTSTGVVYAKQTGLVNLAVTTSPTAVCVDVTANGSSAVIATQTQPAGSSSWSLTLTAGRGDGVQALSVRSWTGIAATGQCDAASAPADAPGSASYILDNTPPIATGTLTPAPNAQGWNHQNVTITWTATDSGVGLPDGLVLPTQTITDDTPSTGLTQAIGVQDRLGNRGGGSVLVKLDKTLPVITGSRTPVANAAGWNNSPVTVSFTCTDIVQTPNGPTGSGVHSCSPPTTLSGEGAGQSVTGTALDNADNTAQATVGGINIDRTPPTLRGTATVPPNAAGWYRGDVTIHWTATDALSGLATNPPPDSTIRGEGTGLTASASITDRAGNLTGATSAPAVRIDRTPPQTTVNAPLGWVNTNQTLTLVATDNLSGVAATHYTVDGGPVQTGNTVTITTEGDHVLTYWSVDAADNEETHHTVHVMIDLTAPLIAHTLDPVPNSLGWNNSRVVVTFRCADGLSGVASCSPPQTVSDEGARQEVVGTAKDVAGNSATDRATVNIDLTNPTIQAAADRAPNAAGWYRDPVTVTFTCADALSGAVDCPDPTVVNEGAGQDAEGRVHDAAGNSASAGVYGMNVDLTAPALRGAPTTDPVAGGWYAGDVTVAWTATDDLSGIDEATRPANSVVTGEGSALSASASVSDQAGNTTGATVAPIRIDRTAPATTITVPDVPASGWYTGDIAVSLDALDSLSGVAASFYSVDGGSAVRYAVPFTFTQRGVHTLTYWSVDAVGNVESSDIGHTITVRIDGTPPTITGSRTPEPNDNGWNNTPVRVSFACADGESGLAGCHGDMVLSDDGANQSVTGSAVDAAGNTAEATVGDINIDQTPPNLSGKPTTDANAAGWYTGDVTVAWTATDGLSGIDDGTRPADKVITEEGDNLGAGPVSVSDLAGNSASASVGGIKIDRHGPEITGAPTTDPNDAGWYTGDVTVAFSCTDTLSGVATCPSDKVITGNGADRSTTSAEARDVAGNATPGITVGGIDIDGLPPTTTATSQCPSSGCGSTAQVLLTATDQDGLSGVQEIHYSVNGGAERVAQGSTVTVGVPLSGGQGTVRFFAVDRAGNVEPANTISLNGDTIAPSVTHTIDPAPNAEGWNDRDVEVTFSAKDNDLGSGVDPGSITSPVWVTKETPRDGVAIVGKAKDMAGNWGTDTVVVRLDQTAPTITGAPTTAPGKSGWHTGPVRVHFTCSDALSGVKVCPDDVILTRNGADQSVTRTAVDAAGETSTATVGNIDIDREPPTITSVSLRDDAIYVLGKVPAPSCTATDSVSGGATCAVTVAGPPDGGTGVYNFTATATDTAGNTATVQGSYRVVYRCDGYQAPIWDLHFFGFGVFRAGSTVPVRIQLKDGNGQVVQGRAPHFVDPVRSWVITAPVSSRTDDDAGTPDDALRWDAASRGWVYMWSTRGMRAGYLYRIGVTLDDGRTYYAYVGLR